MNTIAAREVRMNGLMRTFIDWIETLTRPLLSFFAEFYTSLDNANTAWREGKALFHLQTILADDDETGEISEIAEDPDNSEDRLYTTVVVIATRSVPSPLAKFKIEHMVKQTNSRFGAHLSVRFVQVQPKAKNQ